MLQTYLINILIFAGIILLLVLVVAAIQMILILLEARRAAKELKAKVAVITSAIDVVSMVLGGVEGAKARIIKNLIPGKKNINALVAGVKKGVSVLVQGKKGRKK